MSKPSITNCPNTFFIIVHNFNCMYSLNGAESCNSTFNNQHYLYVCLCANTLQQAVEDEQAFVVMPVRTLFEMTLGETLFLNAKLPTGKEFMPREISLLIGEEGNPLSSQEILEGGESLILSEVAEPPAQMIDSLTTLFKTIKPVKRAFICSIKENEEAQPNLLIGIEADGDIEEIIQATGSVATDTLPGDEPIDICQVKKGEKGISHFITEHIAPFYERRWGGFLRDFKQNRII